MKNVSILLCDDHALLRDGLKSLLDAEPDLSVVGEAENGIEAVAALERLTPDVVLMDINMPGQNGIETVKQMVELQPDVCILMLTMFAHEEYLMESVRAGARGYLLKDAPIDTVIEAIRKVMNGEDILHRDMLKKMGQPSYDGGISGNLAASTGIGKSGGVGSNNGSAGASPFASDAALGGKGTNGSSSAGLSPREEEVLQLLVDGYANKDIADLLFITPATVKLHISNVYRKLGVKSRSQAITRAVRMGLVKLSSAPPR